MIKRFIFIALCYCLASGPVAACDVCGCASGNMGIGLFSAYRSNYLRIAYNRIAFNSISSTDTRIADRFQSWELSARYALTKRIRVMAFVPYNLNSRRIQGDFLIEQGLSDPRLTASYVLVNKQTAKSGNIYLEAGAGLSLPTGKFDPKLHNKDLPDNFNVGKGSWAYLFQADAIWTYRKTGIVLSSFYQLNSPTKSGYTFGNQFNIQGIVFREIPLKTLDLIPNAGIAFLSSAKDSYANGNPVHGTGGNGVFATAGINLKNDRWMAGVNYSLPLTGQYSDGVVVAGARYSAQITYIF